MMKSISYSNSFIESHDIDSVPHAVMSDVLSLAVKGSWPDYLQVLNSSEDLIYDLHIKCIDDVWLIPVCNVSSWLYSFSIRNMRGCAYDRFRIFRRDVEKVLRVAWALPVEDLVCKTYEVPYEGFGEFNIYDLVNIFLSFGIQEEEMEGSVEEGEEFGPLHYIEFIAGCTSCGPQGSLLCEQIQYIEDMPNGDIVFNHINDILMTNLVPPTGYLDDYLDNINSFISSEATRFVGEL